MKGSAIVLSFLAGKAESFAPFLSKTASLELNLMPGQGSQLVAAYNAASCQKEQGKSQIDIKVRTDVTDHEEQALNAARSFASRLFSVPSALISGRQQDDIVLYPLVGFKLVHYDDQVIVLPTKSHVACRLPSSKMDEEGVVGWFSPACSLNLYAEDISEDPNNMI
jgi:hypothetical protein